MRRISAFVRRRVALLPSLRGQDGSLLVEVMVGAVLVVTVSAAVLDGLGGAQDTGQRNRARSVSASVAQQDQERLRAKPVAQLSNYRETRSVTLQNIDYTVVSRADWVNDGSGVVSCTNDSGAAQYLKISSSVNSKLNSGAPVTQTSLVSPPRGTFGDDEGTAAVQVVDREQRPLEGVRVDLIGPQTFSDVTNDLGCVVFGYIEEGPWKAKVTSLGLVGTDGKSPFVTDLDVVGGSTVVKQVLLDKPASITATFDTFKLGAVGPEATAWPSVSISNSQMPSPGFTTFKFGTPQTSITADKVFPFLDGYGVYAGDCDPNNPVNYQDDYFTTVPGSAALATTDPEGSANVVARLPAINIQVQNSSGVAQAGARVFLMAEDVYQAMLDPDDELLPECGGPTTWTTSSASPWRQTSGDGVNPVGQPVLIGALPAPAFPFGPYRVCADNGLSSTSKRYTGKVLINNTAAAGTTPNIPPIKYLAVSPSPSTVNRKLCTDP